MLFTGTVPSFAAVADDERSGWPKTAFTTDIIESVHQMVLDDRRIKVREIVEAMGIPKERICHIVTEELGMRKLSTRWVPRLLTLNQKRIPMDISKALLDRFKQNETDFLH